MVLSDRIGSKKLNEWSYLEKRLFKKLYKDVTNNLSLCQHSLIWTICSISFWNCFTPGSTKSLQYLTCTFTLDKTNKRQLNSPGCVNVIISTFHGKEAKTFYDLIYLTLNEMGIYVEGLFYIHYLRSLLYIWMIIILPDLFYVNQINT